MTNPPTLAVALAEVVSEIRGTPLDGPAVAVMSAGLAGMLSAFADTPTAPGWTWQLSNQARELSARLWTAAGPLSLSLVFGCDGERGEA